MLPIIFVSAGFVLVAPPNCNLCRTNSYVPTEFTDDAFALDDEMKIEEPVGVDQVRNAQARESVVLLAIKTTLGPLKLPEIYEAHYS